MIYTLLSINYAKRRMLKKFAECARLKEKKRSKPKSSDRSCERKDKKMNRQDIINNIPRKGMLIIATKLGCSQGHVSSILKGTRNQNTKIGRKIIDAAQVMAALNIWNQRFCKDTPNLNPIKVAISNFNLGLYSGNLSFEERIEKLEQKVKINEREIREILKR